MAHFGKHRQVFEARNPDIVVLIWFQSLLQSEMLLRLGQWAEAKYLQPSSPILFASHYQFLTEEDLLQSAPLGCHKMFAAFIADSVSLFVADLLPKLSYCKFFQLADARCLHPSVPIPLLTKLPFYYRVRVSSSFSIGLMLSTCNLHLLVCCMLSHSLFTEAERL